MIPKSSTTTLLWLLCWFYRRITAIAWHYLFNRYRWFQKSSGQSKHFVGLKNQGATCYLNTLLQTWFMTQEVKECITNCREQDSLICELRNLFDQLSDGNEQSLSTEQLTSQLNLNVYIQRDIEECFRSLVNKLNSKMDQEHNMLKIYQATMVNSLKCLKCKQSMDEDTFFLDIPLSVCSANAAEKFDSMEKSLDQFLKEEKMEGDNKCYCDNCEMKTEATSRYYFKHLPQILTFQLKRFEFNHNYMAFKKITDSITLPTFLKFTRSQVNNGQNDSHVDVEKEEETPDQTQKVNGEDFVDFTGRNAETSEDHSQKVSTGQEMNNVQNDSQMDVVKEDETPVQNQEVNEKDSVDITGRTAETPQDHPQQVSTNQEVGDAQNDTHGDVTDEGTCFQQQRESQEDPADSTGRNSETPQGHPQQVSAGQEEVNALNDSDVGIVMDKKTPVEHQKVNQEDTLRSESGRYAETPQGHSRQVSAGQERRKQHLCNVNSVQNDTHGDVTDKRTRFQQKKESQNDSADFTGRNPNTPQDHPQQVSAGQEEVNASNDSHVGVVENKRTPVEHQKVNLEDTLRSESGRNRQTPQGHSQQVSAGEDRRKQQLSNMNNADNHWHVVVVKDEKTPVQAQEMDQEYSADSTGRNAKTPQDHPQQVSTGQEEKRYELFAIWHHVGSYGNGHYYAEIKSDSDWYNFNDENVEKKTEINLSSKTAYVLMYKVIDTNYKAEPPARVSKNPMDEWEKGKPVLGRVMAKLMLGWAMAKPVLGWLMRKLRLSLVMRMLMLGWVMVKPVLGWLMRKLRLSLVMRKLMLGWVMAKPVLGWVISKMVSLPVQGENCTPQVEGDDDAPPVEGDDDTPPLEGEVGSPRVEREVNVPPMEGEASSPRVEVEVGWHLAR